MRRPAFAAAIVGLGALLFSGSAQACTCAKLPAQAAFRQADAAIAGRLMRVETVDRFSANYLYRVRRVYKTGPGLKGGETVWIRSGPNGASCGLPRDKKRWYGLFLGRNEDGWHGGLCGIRAPREIAAAAAGSRRGDDLAATGSGAAVPGCAS